MKMHPRYFIVQEARAEVSKRIMEDPGTTGSIVKQIGLILADDFVTVGWVAPFAEAIRAIAERHELTPAELIQVLAGELAIIAKYSIRAERHPDKPDEPGDIE